MELEEFPENNKAIWVKRNLKASNFLKGFVKFILGPLHALLRLFSIKLEERLENAAG